MSYLKSAGKFLVVAAKGTGKVGLGSLRVTGSLLNGAAKVVASHQEEIVDLTKTVVNASGKAVKESGRALTVSAGALSKGLHEAGSASQGTTGRILGHVAGYTADAIGVVGKAAQGIGHLTQSASPAIGSATGSAVSGVVGTVSYAVDSVAITERDFEDLRLRLQIASVKVQAESQKKSALIDLAIQRRSKKDLLDLLVVGGITLSAIVRDPSSVPPDVEQAFELAYPGLAGNGETFADAVQRLPTDHVLGIVNGVKGKLFEIELVEHFNADHLHDGLHAELASSATQPGYDIKILDANGHTVDVLQAKATESATYVKDAIERYPNIDITSTTEVHAHLVALGTAEHVVDSQISEAVLRQKVEDAMLSGHHIDASNLAPSSIGLAVIALSTFLDKNMSLEQKGAEFGDRAAKSSVAGAAAKAVLVASQTWWLGLAVGVGTRALASYGGNRRQRYEALLSAVKAIEDQSRPFAVDQLPTLGLGQ